MLKGKQVSEQQEKIKGKKFGLCNRSVCQSVDNVVWYNGGTRAFYCPKCAALINRSNHEILGYNLCVDQTQIPPFATSTIDQPIYSNISAFPAFMAINKQAQRHREEGACELKDLLSTLDLLCTTHDLRLGQALVLAITDKQVDLFNIENDALEILVKKKLET